MSWLALYICGCVPYDKQMFKECMYNLQKPYQYMIVVFEDKYYNCTMLLHALKFGNKEAVKHLWKAGDYVHIHRWELDPIQIVGIEIPVHYITSKYWNMLYECLAEWIHKYTRIIPELKFSMMAWTRGQVVLRSQWLVYEHEHWFQMQRVYKQYGVDSVKGIFNASPSIDHERKYGKLPLYFKHNDGLDWLVNYYEHLEPGFQLQTHTTIAEMTGICAAHSIGKSSAGYLRVEMGWSDVVGEVLSLRGHLALPTHARLLNKIKDIHGQDVVNRMG